MEGTLACFVALNYCLRQHVLARAATQRQKFDRDLNGSCVSFDKLLVRRIDEFLRLSLKARAFVALPLSDI